jgi:hypothetical protein
MRTLLSRKAFAQSIASVMADRQALAEIHAEMPVPPDVTSWLASLAVLKNVPFSYLVPHESMLPTESIRFFAVDTSWINALLQGACSIGRASSAGAAQESVLSAKLLQAGNANPVVTGFLLRSGVVQGWPALEVSAYDKDGTELGNPPLRMERLAPNVLLYLVAGTINRVAIHEPAEGVHFGVAETGNTVNLRYITVPPDITRQPNPQPGDEIKDNDSARTGKKSVVTIGTRGAAGTPGERVLQIAKLAKAMQQQLSDIGANSKADGDARPFTSAEFAVQMIEVVPLVNFNNKSS